MASTLKPLLSLDDIIPVARAGTPIRWAGWTMDNDGQTWPVITLTSCNSTTDKFTKTDHGLLDDMAVQLESTGVLPAITDPFSGSGSSVLDPTFVYYVRDATKDDFKLCILPGEAAIDLTGTGTGTHSIRRVLSRRWLWFMHGEWWRIGIEGEAILCNANDITTDEISGDQWTWLSEDCLAKRRIDQLVQPVWKDDVSCADPVGAVADEILPPSAVSDESRDAGGSGSSTTVIGGPLLGGGDVGDTTPTPAGGGDAASALLGGGNADEGGGGGGGGSGSGSGGSGSDSGNGSGSGNSGSNGGVKPNLPSGENGGGGGSGDGGGGNDDAAIDVPAGESAGIEIAMEIKDFGSRGTGTGLLTCYIGWMFTLVCTNPKFANRSYSVAVRTGAVGGFQSLWQGYVFPNEPRTHQGFSTIRIGCPIGGSAVVTVRATVSAGGQVIDSDHNGITYNG